MTWQIIEGGCLDVLRGMADASVECCICDPPYGLGKEPTTEDIVRYLQGDDVNLNGRDFMGRDWQIPSVAIWKEVYRVVKPGGYLLAFVGTRTWDLLSLGIRAAGFENRDTIRHDFGPSVIGWVYGSGFPKSASISKQLDKMAGVEREVVGKSARHVSGKPEQRTAGLCGTNTFAESIGMGATITAPATEAAKQWDGYGTALKPSWEVVLMFRRSISEKTVAANMLKWGTGGLNIDATRVGTDEVPTKPTSFGGGAGWEKNSAEGDWSFHKGRWPSNFCLSHSEGCRRVGERKVKGSNGTRGSKETAGQLQSKVGWGTRCTGLPVGYADEDGTEAVPDWICQPGCPVRELDAQSGVLKSGSRARGVRHGIGYGSGAKGDDSPVLVGNVGTASRFFNVFSGEPDPLPDPLDDVAPFFYCAKSSRRERDSHLRGSAPVGGGDGVASAAMRNIHPTVKPLKLMAHLCKLVCPPNGTVLDPFCGSGSTGVAALREGFNFIGIERDAEYAAICRVRLQHEQPQVVRRGMP